ncbi:hypothetical protein GGS20DRAFT_587945 [Poronia punctata]|nr:hypothetical protein GGS20DRAFT_587945 [Poronia punctata]
MANDLGKNLAIALGIAGGATFVLLVVLCFLAHFGTHLCGARRKERWFSRSPEEGMVNAPAFGDKQPILPDLSAHEPNTREQAARIKALGNPRTRPDPTRPDPTILRG